MVPQRQAHGRHRHPPHRQRREESNGNRTGTRRQREAHRPKEAHAHVSQPNLHPTLLTHTTTQPSIFTPHPSYVSPRKRAQRTFELLNLGFTDLPWHPHGPAAAASDHPDHPDCGARIEVTEDIREWDYGDYEGVTTSEIRDLREAQGLGRGWDIWRDGCPGGESPAEVTVRMDRLIGEIRSAYQGPHMKKGGGKSGGKGAPGEGADEGTGDVLVVGHGHILRAFAMRWVGKNLDEGPTFLMEAGGVGTLRYVAVIYLPLPTFGSLSLEDGT